MRISLIISMLICLLISCSPSTEELYATAQKHLEQKEYKKAIEVYTKIIKRNSKFQDAVFFKGYCYLLDSNYARALHYYEYLLRLKGVHITDSSILTQNVNIFASQEERSHEISLGEVYRQIGITRYYIDSLSSSYAYLQRSIDQNNEVADCLTWQGLIWTRTDSAQKSCEYFQRAKELGQPDLDRLLNMYCQKKK